jgi:hypothetical protein
MRNAMSTVIMVGDSPLIISGTDSTLIMVTNDRISPTTSVGMTCGTRISNRMRRRPAPRFLAASMVERSSDAIAPATSSATNGVCFQTKVMMMPRQSRKPIVWSTSRSRG